MHALALLAWSLASSQPGCVDLHPGMSCVPAQKAIIGKGAAKRAVELSRYWVDAQPITPVQYAACVAAGACVALPAPPPKADAVARLDWQRAERYCAFAGKRLPTEAEWEVAAVLGAITGDEEWTRTWLVSPATKCRGHKGAALEEESTDAWARALCGSIDEQDACDGAAFCGKLGRRVVKRGASPTSRVGQSWWTNKRWHAARCATSREYLTAFPPLAISAPLARPAALAPPTPAQVAAFARVREDTVEVPPCDEPGRSYLDCRDPRSYLKSNEPLLGVVARYVANRGGGYTGVGSDQQYTLVAHARPSWAWLFDYDENVVRWHHVLRALILAAPDRHAFAAFFEEKGRERALAAIAERYPARAQQRILQSLWRGAAPPLASHYRSQASDPALSWSWLGSDERYAFIRTLYEQGRMNAWLGNMLEKNTMKDIGDAARAVGVPIRVYYPSNAPEFWELTDGYRENVLALPFDEDSVVVQTLSGMSMKTGFGQKGYWHYNVQYGLEQQEMLRLPGFTRHRQVLYHRVKSDSPELTLTGMPSSAAP